MKLLTILLFFSLTILSGCEDSTSDNDIEDTRFRRVGLAVFNIQHPGFKCDDFLEVTKDIPQLNIALLTESFGNNNGCLGRVSMTGRLNLLQFYLEDETCDRIGTCYEPLNVFDGTPEEYDELVFNQEGWLYQRIFDRLLSVRDIVINLDVPECLISPGLESNLSKDSMDILMTFIRNTIEELMPGRCQLVFNPVDDIGPNSTTNFYEHHRGPFPTFVPNRPAFPVVCNNDGTHIDHGSIINYPRVMSLEDAKNFLAEGEQRCFMTFLWAADLSNGIIDNDNLPFPHERDPVSWLNGVEIIDLIR